MSTQTATAPVSVTSPDWLATLAGAPPEKLVRWEPPRLTTQARPASAKRVHAARFATVCADPGMPPARWIPLPKPKQSGADQLADRGPDPTPAALELLAGVARRRPRQWMVAFAGDRPAAARLKHLVDSGQGVFDSRRGGWFDAFVRISEDRMMQVHIRFTPHNVVM